MLYKTIDLQFIYEGKDQNIFILDDAAFKYFGKTASAIDGIAEKLYKFEPPQKIVKAIEEYESTPDKVALVINAVGAFETWGLNSKGDGFLRKDLKKDYITYEEYGKVYYRHAKFGFRDPFGIVKAADYHDGMDLVTLFVVMDLNAAPKEAIDLLMSREMPGTSMGTQIEYDICTICGHKAPTIRDHCDHVKFHLLEILNGVDYVYDPQVGMLNVGNKFRDISLTPFPAWEASSVIQKVAERPMVLFELRVSKGEIRDMEPEVEVKEAAKNSQAEKITLADMEKDIVINPDVKSWGIFKPELALLATEKPLVNRISKLSPVEAINFFDSHLAIPNVHEVALMISISTGNYDAADSLINGTKSWLRAQIDKQKFNRFLETVFNTSYNPRYYDLDEEACNRVVWGPFVVQRVIGIVNTPPGVIRGNIDYYKATLGEIEHAIEDFLNPYESDKLADSKTTILLPIAALLGLKAFGLRRFMSLPAVLKYGIPAGLAAVMFKDPLLNLLSGIFGPVKYYQDYEAAAQGNAPVSVVSIKPPKKRKPLEHLDTLFHQ